MIVFHTKCGPVFRFADRDMLMRFYWGLGVGHVYSHQEGDTGEDMDIDEGESEGEDETMDGDKVLEEDEDENDDELVEGEPELSNAELGLNDLEGNPWYDEDDEDLEDEENINEETG